MARRAQGFTLRDKDGIWCVRFRHEGKRYELSTGHKVTAGSVAPGDAAAAEGRRLYSETCSGRRKVGSVTASGADVALVKVTEAWVKQLAVRDITRGVYDGYTLRWIEEWPAVKALSDTTIAAYLTARLREVQRKSVLNEASALRNFCGWLHAMGYLAAPLAVPTVSKATNGKRYAHRRRVKAPDLAPAEIEKLLAHLPLKARWGHAVRARFCLMFDTTLRPATLDKLSVPENWAPGEVVLRIAPDDDKESADREIPLTDRALAALELSAPAAGLIFGTHNYRGYLAKAAAAALPPSKAAIFTGQHLRSAAITRYLELPTSSLAGVMSLTGQKHASTTSRYIRASLRAASAVVAPFVSNRGRLPDSPPNEVPFTADLVAPTLGLEHKNRGKTTCKTPAK